MGAAANKNRQRRVWRIKEPRALTQSLPAPVMNATRERGAGRAPSRGNFFAQVGRRDQLAP